MHLASLQIVLELSNSEETNTFLSGGSRCRPEQSGGLHVCEDLPMASRSSTSAHHQREQGRLYSLKKFFERSKHPQFLNFKVILLIFESLSVIQDFLNNSDAASLDEPDPLELGQLLAVCLLADEEVSRSIQVRHKSTKLRHHFYYPGTCSSSSCFWRIRPQSGISQSQDRGIDQSMQ
jgi:hypothetical protein